MNKKSLIKNFIISTAFCFTILAPVFSSGYIKADEKIAEKEFFELSCDKPESSPMHSLKVSLSTLKIIEMCRDDTQALGELGEESVSNHFKKFKWECEYTDSKKEAPTVYLDECGVKYGSNNGIDHIFFLSEEYKKGEHRIDLGEIESKGRSIKKAHPLIIIHESKFQAKGGSPIFNGDGCKASCSKDRDVSCPQMSWRWAAHAAKRIVEDDHTHSHSCEELRMHILSNVTDSGIRLTRVIRTASVLDATGKLSFFAVGNSKKEIKQSKEILAYILRNCK